MIRLQHKREPFPLMISQLRGTQAQMGAQHGAMTRAAGSWEEALAYYPRMPEILLGGGSPAARVALRPVIELALARLERARPAELRQRTRSFLRALGAPLGQSRYLQVMDVLQNIINTAGRLQLGPFRAQELGQNYPGMCSTLVAWGDATQSGRLLHARNFDFPGVGVWETRPELVFCTPRKGMRYGFVALRGGDVPCVTAFNEAGLTLTLHTRFHRDVAWSGLGAVDICHQIIREARSLEEAQAVVERQPISSSWGLCVSSAQQRRAISLEICGARVRRVEPGQQEDFLAVTNRYVHPEMQQGEVTLSPSFVQNSDGRYHYLRQKAVQGDLNPEIMRALLCGFEDVEAPGVLRPSGGVTAQLLSVHSVLVDPEKQQLHLSVGPAPTGAGPWATLDWSWDHNPGFSIETFEGQQLDTYTTAFTHGDGARAYESLLQSVALQNQGAQDAQVGALLEQAARLDPQTPTYRFLAGGACLQRGDVHAALEHFHFAQEQESSPFFKGLALLWASRCAHAAADEVVAQKLRQELQGLDHALLAQSQAAARREAHKPLPVEKLQKLRIQHHLADLALH